MSPGPHQLVCGRAVVYNTGSQGHYQVSRGDLTSGAGHLAGPFYFWHRTGVSIENRETTPVQISDELQRLAADARGKCITLAYQASVRLADLDSNLAVVLCEARSRGDRMMIAVDVDSPDGLIRLVSVSADQHFTQHAAFGLFTPSSSRN